MVTDTIYTERYMGLPTEEDNEENYIASDVTQEIDQFKNHDFMLIHGTGDDNVHYQQSLALAKSLQLAGILFEQVVRKKDRLYPLFALISLM